MKKVRSSFTEAKVAVLLLFVLNELLLLYSHLFVCLFFFSTPPHVFHSKSDGLGSSSCYGYCLWRGDRRDDE